MSASFSWATDPEGLLRSAYLNLRSTPALSVRLSGYEKSGNQSHSLLVDAIVDNASPQPRYVIWSIRDGQESYRWVADGSTFVFLDRLNLEARAVPYIAADARSSSFQSLVNTSTGAATFVSRLTRDIYGGDAATFKTWMPEAVPTWGGDSNWTWVAYTSQVRQVVYWLDSPTGNLAAIDYKLKDGSREMQWRMSLTTYGYLQQNWSFNFVPPAGVRYLGTPRTG